MFRAVVEVSLGPDGTQVGEELSLWKIRAGYMEEVTFNEFS